MKEPEWANVRYEKPKFQDISYYSAPVQKKQLDSLDQVDPELLKTFANYNTHYNRISKCFR